MQAKLPGVDSGKEILTDERQQQERGRHYRGADDEGPAAMLKESMQQGRVTALYAQIAGVEPIVESPEPRGPAVFGGRVRSTLGRVDFAGQQILDQCGNQRA